MTNIREYQKNKLKNASKNIDNRHYTKKVIFHKGRKLFIICALIAVVIFLIIGYSIYKKNRVYEDYDVLSISQITQNVDSKYLKFNDKILRYGMDGIVCLDKNASKQWEISYQMKYPIVALCKNYGVVASQKGHEIYVFNQNGLAGSMVVDYPIVDISVAAQGAVAVSMEKDGINYLDIYEANGEKKVASKTSLEGNGYPIDSRISPDGQKLMVSYLDIAEDTLASSVVFYNFSDVGEDYIWNMVGVYDDYYEGTMIPYVEFVNDYTACAVGDNRITIFDMKEIPEVVADIGYDGELAAFVGDESYIGLVFDNEEHGGLYRLEIYDIEGKKVLSYDIDMEYKEIQFVNEHVLVYNDNRCILLSMGGVEKFNYTFDKSYECIMPLSITNYIMITKTTISEIGIK
ncbi:MAG: hypothetical protein IJW18_09450 [Lachnospiraceae bacterium]|nr:hypothetical protein [Lachnospiraceae bacterium]